MSLRLERVNKLLCDNELDGIILSSPANISYITEYRSRDSYLLVSNKQNIYFTDSRYIEEAKRSLSKNFCLKNVNGSLFETIADTCLFYGLKRIGFEERHLPFAEHKKIEHGLRRKSKLIPTRLFIEKMRELKEPREVKMIKEAIKITSKALKFAEKTLSVGRKEIEIAGDLECFIRYSGAISSAFEIIVASGPNSSFPHHVTSARKIKKNEPVLIDIGVDYFGYKSDLTRVFFLGRIKALHNKIYDIVFRAQEKAINRIKPGISIGKIDSAARQYIASQGYGGFFGHNLGHGIGLDVHEEPHISRKESKVLEAGMVFTVEPAVYIPGEFGIRLEDIVEVTKKGCEVLSGFVNK